MEWNISIERVREKAKKLIGSVIAVYQTTSIVSGILKDVSIERLWSIKCPYCKLKIENFKRFDLEGNLISESDEEIVFVNKSEFLFSLNELEKANKKVYKKVMKSYGLEPS